MVVDVDKLSSDDDGSKKPSTPKSKTKRKRKRRSTIIDDFGIKVDQEDIDQMVYLNISIYTCTILVLQDIKKKKFISCKI